MIITEREGGDCQEKVTEGIFSRVVSSQGCLHRSWSLSYFTALSHRKLIIMQIILGIEMQISCV